MNKTATQAAWDILCDAADTIIEVSEVKPRKHPFEKTLGKGPYKLLGYSYGEAECEHCGTRIKNIYSISTGDGSSRIVGSECVLKTASADTDSLVQHVKREKRGRDRLKKQARNEAKRKERTARGLAESRSQYPREVAWLEAYSGNFDFYLSLRTQLLMRGFLTERQWQSATRAVEKDSMPRVAQPSRIYSAKAGDVFILSKWLARKIASLTSCVRPHFAFEVVEVIGESERAYNVELKLSAQRTTHCCVCGLHLTNPRSVANGIGPICADGWEVESLDELETKLMVYSTTKTWIPKSQIKKHFKVKL